MIRKFTVSNDPAHYEAFPDVVLTPSGKLICVCLECVHHLDRSRTALVMTESADRGRTWSPKRTIVSSDMGQFFYNCPRLSLLSDGRIAMTVDRFTEKPAVVDDYDHVEVVIFFSADEGASWSEPLRTPLRGIVPDKLIELKTGRWLLAAHNLVDGNLAEYLRYSDDGGVTWSDLVTVAKVPGLNLCEISILPVDDGTLVGFLRENSWKGCDCKKVISTDNGESWGEVHDFALQGCHRPTSLKLQDGRILITYRYLPGIRGGWGYNTQNLFAALAEQDAVLTTERGQGRIRILPVDYDRSAVADTGYSGSVQFPDGEIFLVNYLVDDSVTQKAQIRGYSLRMEDFILPL